MEEVVEIDARPRKRLRVAEDEFEDYDVFISHRGPDTKTGFVGFLCKALETAGLRVFLDCKSIDKGQDAWKCIDHAIRKTPIALVIFSEGFAESEWCLRELHVMLETHSVKVVPVFYKVQPREVSYPEKGQLADGFEKLRGRHDEIVIEQWRADLRSASKLNGWVYRVADLRLERDVVAEIAKRIFEMANKPPPLDAGEYLVGVKQVVDHIIHVLDDKRVLMLGLWGTGGIGKSTLARELYNQLGKKFALSCYVEDLTEKVIQGGEVNVQNHMLKDLCKDDLEEIKDKSRAKIILEERLCKKQVLVVLDDASDNVELHYLMTRKMLMGGSLCIVTSRNRRVFERSSTFDLGHEIHVHHVQELNKKDSKQLFTSFAFGGECKVKPGFEELVANTSEACRGVPLALKVCGALLKDEEDKDIWIEVRNKLNCGTIMDEVKIFECLRISYDALQEQHQEMFLDIACGLLGKSKDMATCVWKSRGWSPALGIRSLVERALVGVDVWGRFTMHDHLRDMGREIERKRRTSKGVWRRLWMPESLTMVKEGKLLPNSLQILIISSYGNYRVDLDLSHMKGLYILECGGAINVTSLLPKCLSWLNGQLVDGEGFQDSWLYGKRQSYGIGSIFNVGALKHMVILILNMKNHQNLFESFGELCNLEVMDVSGYGGPSELPVSLGRLTKLLKLNLRDSGIQSLPESFGELCNLEELNLNNCARLSELPGLFGRLTKLLYVDLAHSGVQSLPESFGELCNLEELNLSWCTKLSELPGSFGRLTKLLKLHLAYSGVQSLPESFGELCNLEELNLSGCSRLSELPGSFGRLTKLLILDLAFSRVQSLPESFGELCNLEELNLNDCERLSELSGSFGRLTKLLKLDLAYSQVQSLPESFGEMCNLKELDLSGCRGLIELPGSFGRLTKLLKLDLAFSRVQSLPESFGELCNLEELNLSGCIGLSELPGSFGRFTLDMSNCESLTVLPKAFGNLSSLTTLDVSECESLTVSSKAFGNLSSLTTLLDVDIRREHDVSIDALIDEIMKINNICEVSSDYKDLQSLLHGKEAVVFCCFDAKSKLFEFYFKNRESMASIVGVGLEYGKALLIEGWKVHIKEISKMEWQQTLERVKSSPTTVYRSLKLETCLPHLIGNEVDVGYFMHTGRPLLWNLAKYFTLKEAIETEDMQVKCVGAGGASSSNPQPSSESIGEGYDGDDEDEDEKYQTLDKAFRKWHLKKSGDDNGNNEYGNHEHGEDLVDAIDKFEDTTVSIELLSGGKFAEAKDFDVETMERLSSLNNTIVPNLKFTFTIQDETRQIMITIGDVSFYINQSSNDFHEDRGSWLHKKLKVSLGLLCDDSMQCAVVKRGSFKQLDVEPGTENLKASHTIEKKLGKDKAFKGRLYGKPHGVGISGAYERTTREDDGDIQHSESSVERSVDRTRGGLLPVEAYDSSRRQIACEYSVDHPNDKYNLPRSSPMLNNQHVKFQGAWIVSESSPTFAEYVLMASRYIEEIVPPQKKKVSDLSKSWQLPLSGRSRNRNSEGSQTMWKQIYESKVLINHSMTHLDGKVHTLEEKV